MSTFRKIDQSTLGWVKSEIDETLKQARVALESFIDNPADKTHLQFCITHLHQVVGTLTMVELDGAAMLAIEIESLAGAVFDGKVEATHDALQSLTHGILALPDYLERLQAGYPDMPLRQLPLINELRSVRGVEPISEIALFAPDLSIQPPRRDSTSPKLTDAEYSAYARERRPIFQAALLAWLREPDNAEPLRNIAEVFDEFEKNASSSAIEQLFWVAGGLIEVLIDGGLDSPNESKKHMARLDQQIKRIIDGGEKSQLRSASETLVKAILFDLSHATSSGPRVVELKRVFTLDTLLSDETQGAAADLYDRPSPEVLQSVARMLGKEIEQAQDMLATAFDPQSPDANAIQSLPELLHKMAGTLDMLSVPLLKMLVDEVAIVCRALLENKLPDPAVAAMPMAQALLLVENSARDIHRPVGEWEQQIERAITVLRGLLSLPEAVGTQGIEVAEAKLTESELKELLGVVGIEIGVNLGKIEEALEAFATNSVQRERLTEVPGYLGQIEGVLQVLGLDNAVKLVTAVGECVASVYEGRITPTNEVLDSLAVSVGTIGAYVEGVRAGRQNRDKLVDTALTEMDAAIKRAPAGTPSLELTSANNKDLESALTSWLESPNDNERRALFQQQLEDLPGNGKVQQIRAEILRLLELVTQDPSALSNEAIQTLEKSCKVLIELSRLAASGSSSSVASVTTRPAPTPVAASEEEFDQEMMQVFVEDANEVLERIVPEFERWRTDVENQTALTELRRGYHTLKGSGRMVGATQIAELAWAIENMLNHVRDGKIETSPAVLDLLTQSETVLPGMIAQLSGGSAPTVNIEQLRQTAWTLVGRAEAPAPPPSKTVKSPTSTTKQQLSASAHPPLPKLDGALLDVFTNEARGHLATIARELAECHAAGGVCAVNTSLTRAIHTLQGNARSLVIPMMVEACAEVEKMLHALSAQALPLVETHLTLIERLASVVTQLIDELNSSGATSDLPQRFAEIARKAHQEHELALASDETAASEAPASSETKTTSPPVSSAHKEIAPATPGTEKKNNSPPSSKPLTQPVSASLSVIATTDAAPAPTIESIDIELLEIFQEEAIDILNNVEQVLRAWRVNYDDLSVVLVLKRALHTLKGGARMAGALIMGDLSHNTETLLQKVENKSVAPTPELLDLLEETHDMLVNILDRIGRTNVLPDTSELNARLNIASTGAPIPAATQDAPPVMSSVAQASTDDTIKVSSRAQVETHETEFASNASSVATPDKDLPKSELEEILVVDRRDPTVEAEPWPQQHERRGQVRVSTRLLSDLVNYAGEVSIARARMEQQIHGFRDNLSELNRNVLRFRDQLRELEIQSESQILYRLEKRSDTEYSDTDFDPLEFDRYSRLQQLTRSLSESLHDLTTIQFSMGSFVGEAETVLQQQARINTELQEGLMRTRMVDFATLGPRLRHIVRSTARELGKRAALNIESNEVQIDRTVLDRMVGPFEHMIRNSLDHGIERETERARAGKSQIGNITIATVQEGNEIVIRFSDDGAGLNTEGIRAKAIERGLMAANAVFNDDELIQFILLPGFSTASEVTHVSGRGVGMDVVHDEVKQLGGSMAVETNRGAGTTFIIRLPLSLSITQALMVHVSDQVFAVPIASIMNIVECPAAQLQEIAASANPQLNYKDESYSFMSLGTRLGIHSDIRGRKAPVLLTHAGAQPVAIQVDSLGSAREIVVKPLGPQLSEIKGLAGATIMGDGRVILILDLAGLWVTDEMMHVKHAPVLSDPIDSKLEVRTVMIVDDSLTVRKVTSKHLKKRDLDVMVAKDGLDAIEQLRERIPNVMLIDIEMPRMDGYELTSRIRSDDRLKHIPIIMITSRAGEKHRERAFELGVDLYMSKPYQEDELFANIDSLFAGRPT